MKNRDDISKTAWFRLCLGVVASAVLTAASARAADLPPVTVPVFLPLTGPAAFVGASEQQGLQVLENQVNRTGGIRNRPLHFTYLDDQANPQIAVQLFNKTAAEGAKVIIGGAFTAACRATMPLAEKASVVFYCLTPAVNPSQGSYVFTGNYDLLDQLETTLAYFRTRGFDRVAFLLGTDASGQLIADHLSGILARPKVKGVVAAAVERFDPASVNLSAQIAKIAAASPQALVIWSAAGLPTAFRSLRDSGLDVPVTTNAAFMVYSVMKQLADVMPKHLYFVAGQWAQYSATGKAPGEIGRFYTSFKGTGIAPDMGTIAAWDPALIVVDALRHVGPDASAAQIHGYIESLHGFVGTNGSYDFRAQAQRGVDPSSLVMVEWSPQKNAWLPAPTK